MNSSHLAADLHVHSFQVVCSFNLFLVSIFGDGVFFFEDGYFRSLGEWRESSESVVLLEGVGCTIWKGYRKRVRGEGVWGRSGNLDVGDLLKARVFKLELCSVLELV